MNDSLKISTPHGPQIIYFAAPTDFSKLLNNYDKIELVIDTRLQRNTYVSETIRSIEDCSIDSNLYYLEVNNLTKNSELLLQLLSNMQSNKLSRRSLVVAIGGGALADLVGVAASLYMRGIDYAVIATSYTAMVDGIISKVAVNHYTTKNMIGAFYSPSWSVVSYQALETLDECAIAYGLVEAWKHAILEDDEVRINQIESLLRTSDYDVSSLIDIAKWSMMVKAKYITRDWDDRRGSHKLLSLGHTAANFFEMAAPLHHCEAVMYGIILEGLIAKEMGVLAESRLQALISTARLFEEVFDKSDAIKRALEEKSLIDHLRTDKISDHGRIKFVIPTDQGIVVEVVNEEVIKSVITAFTKMKFEIKQVKR